MSIAIDTRRSMGLPHSGMFGCSRLIDDWPAAWDTFQESTRARTFVSRKLELSSWSFELKSSIESST